MGPTNVLRSMASSRAHSMRSHVDVAPLTAHAPDVTFTVVCGAENMAEAFPQFPTLMSIDLQMFFDGWTDPIARSVTGPAIG